MPHLMQLLNTLSGWFIFSNGVSSIFKLLMLIVIFGCVVAVAIFNIKNQNQLGNIPNFIFVLCFFIIIYPLFLLFSISFFDANTPLDDRILSPIFIPLTIVFLYFLDKLYIFKRNNLVLKNALIIIALSISIFYVYSGLSWGVSNSNNGLGFSSKAWQDSELILQIKNLPPGSPIISNSPHAVYILTGNSAQALPKERFETTQEENQNYLSDMKNIGSKIQNQHAFVIYFNLSGRDSQGQEDEIISLLSLTQHSNYREGSIYFFLPEN